MAKQKTRMDLPTVDDQAEYSDNGQTAVADANPPAPAAVGKPAITAKALSVPLAEISFGYLPRVCDVRKLTSRQSQALRQLQEALDSQGAKLANGSRIGNPSNAIKWLLESIAG